MSSSTGWTASVNLGSFDVVYIDSLLPVASMFRLEWNGWGFLLDRLWTFWLYDRPYGWVLVIPLWVPFLVLSCWPALAAVRWVRSRPRPGCCAACGYDLRGSVGSASCPECGAGILGVGKVLRIGDSGESPGQAGG